MSAGQLLSSLPPVTENIFKYLSGPDLSTCAMVCSFWNRMAEIEKKRRIDIKFIFQGMHCALHDKTHSSCQECALDLFLDIETDLSKQLRKPRMQPNFCLAFTSTGTVENMQKLFPSFVYPKRPGKRPRPSDSPSRRRDYLKAVIDTAVRQYLPKNCDVSFCVAPGIIGCRADNIPLEIEEGAAVSGLLIPKIPGLEIYRFGVNNSRINVSEMIPESTTIKCVLVFLSQRGTSYTNKIVHDCLLREHCKIAVGGTVVDRTESMLGTVIAFCGPSVQAASVVIKPRDKKEELEQKLRLFKDTGLLENKCFAFMFACVARGFYVYREYNLESSIFHRLYPNVPLMGTFGNGEIGVNYLPHLPTEDKKITFGKTVMCTKKYLHSYTTVFVMVSIKLS